LLERDYISRKERAAQEQRALEKELTQIKIEKEQAFLYLTRGTITDEFFKDKFNASQKR